MPDSLMDLGRMRSEELAVTALLRCNESTARYGLTLTKSQAAELVQVRREALLATGRLELGAGILDRLLNRFRDSPYLTADTYAETLGELVEIFYLYKNETLDQLGDEELLDLMKERFDGVCRGSLELLADRELELTAHELRFRKKPDNPEELQEEEDEDDQWN